MTGRIFSGDPNWTDPTPIENFCGYHQGQDFNDTWEMSTGLGYGKADPSTPFSAILFLEGTPTVGVPSKPAATIPARPSAVKNPQREAIAPIREGALVSVSTSDRAILCPFSKTRPCCRDEGTASKTTQTKRGNTRLRPNKRGRGGRCRKEGLC